MNIIEIDKFYDIFYRRDLVEGKTLGKDISLPKN